ncbi:hypothetical protein [Photobacterium kishitanii]|uniref:Porin family protein n=1 Tax=Photobacterium kishitanii TaxID=318456 RepID=A0A2T3KMI4_9GAMM|nr:hypothetical protein [Photobacterium kishitanii]PSV01013.1 hypothetical protein C9J27_03015 [Photobacterium kishitanii]
MTKIKIIAAVVVACSSLPAFAGVVKAPEVDKVYPSNSEIVPLVQTEAINLGNAKDVSIDSHKSPTKLSSFFADDYLAITYSSRNKLGKHDSFGINGGLNVQGFELTAEMDTFKLLTTGSKGSSVSNVVVYSGSIMHPIVVAEDFDVSVGGKMSRMTVNADNYNSISSAYASMQIRSKFSDSIGAYLGGDYHIWDNTDLIDGVDGDIHKKLTVNAGLTLRVTDQAYLSAGGTWGSDLDTKYGVSAIYKF